MTDKRFVNVLDEDDFLNDDADVARLGQMHRIDDIDAFQLVLEHAFYNIAGERGRIDVR